MSSKLTSFPFIKNSMLLDTLNLGTRQRIRIASQCLRTFLTHLCVDSGFFFKLPTYYLIFVTANITKGKSSNLRLFFNIGSKYSNYLLYFRFSSKTYPTEHFLILQPRWCRPLYPLTERFKIIVSYKNRWNVYIKCVSRCILKLNNQEMISRAKMHFTIHLH